MKSLRVASGVLRLSEELQSLTLLARQFVRTSEEMF
jgi:hypothetical protein